MEENNSQRYCGIKSLQGTRNFHSFSPIDKFQIEAFPFSGCHSSTKFNFEGKIVGISNVNVVEQENITYCVNDYVIVPYLTKWYLGQIKVINAETLVIHFMDENGKNR